MGLLTETEQDYYDGNNFGNYQFVSLEDIINQFMVVYVGDQKIISKTSRVDVAFHAQRALQELSFDTFKSTKAQEITVPASLQMVLPQDYVNYTKVSWVDSAGIKHLLYPTSKTSNPRNFPNAVKTTLTGVLAGTAFIRFTGEITNLGVGDNAFIPGLADTRIKSIVLNANIFGPATTDIYFGESGSVSYVDIIAESATTSAQGYELQDGVSVEFSAKSDTVSIFERKKEGVVVELQYHIDSNIATAASAADISSLKVGMRVMSATNYFISTAATVYITGISNDQVYLSESADFSSGGINIVSIFHEGALNEESATWSNYKSATPSENQDDYQDDTYWPMNGSRYGLDPQHAQANGSFYIDNRFGKINFSSNISGKTVILDYISDGLGTDAEMQVHKFAEDAMYKYIVHAILSGSSYGQQLVPRLTKEKFAAIRKAKLRLSSIKLEELTQILRGRSKQIKH